MPTLRVDISSFSRVRSLRRTSMDWGSCSSTSDLPAVFTTKGVSSTSIRHLSPSNSIRYLPSSSTFRLYKKEFEDIFSEHHSPVVKPDALFVYPDGQRWNFIFRVHIHFCLSSRTVQNHGYRTVIYEIDLHHGLKPASSYLFDSTSHILYKNIRRVRQPVLVRRRQ